MIKSAFREWESTYRLVVLRDGREGVLYLSGTGAYGDRGIFPLPAVLLLGLQVANVDGYRFLRWVRGSRGLAGLAVVVLVDWPYSPDIKRAYALGASSFLVLGEKRETLLKDLELALSYWAPLAEAA